ncbi:MAG: glycosyltransferase family 4 protein [Chloroflexota bacterium]|nr:glycosyltransferase family 4 protein [Chloroflexota bacterium]
MRVLLLTRYGPMGASSRYRSYQFLPYLEEQGFEVDVLPLLDDAYLHARYAGAGVSRRRVVAAYARRLGQLLRSRQFDLVWLEKEALPWLPSAIESLLLAVGAPYVVDYDDALFHRYDQHPAFAVRALLGNKIDRVMRGAALVILGSSYLAARARAAGARQVAILPTVIDLQRYPPAPAAKNEIFTIGWIGTPLTARLHLETIRGPLETLCAGGKARVVAIGAGDLGWQAPVKVRAWSGATEVADLQGIDVGIMPLPDSPFERGKCGFKLIQYMACGRPVVGSPVGVNDDLIDPGVNGFKATTPEEWIRTLDTLRANRELRRGMGEAGRGLVERAYCLQVAAPRLDELLREAATRTAG